MKKLVLIPTLLMTLSPLCFSYTIFGLDETINMKPSISEVPSPTYAELKLSKNNQYVICEIDSPAASKPSEAIWIHVGCSGFEKCATPHKLISLNGHNQINQTPLKQGINYLVANLGTPLKHPTYPLAPYNINITNLNHVAPPNSSIIPQLPENTLSITCHDYTQHAGETKDSTAFILNAKNIIPPKQQFNIPLIRLTSEPAYVYTLSCQIDSPGKIVIGGTEAVWEKADDKFSIALNNKKISFGQPVSLASSNNKLTFKNIFVGLAPPMTMPYKLNIKNVNQGGDIEVKHCTAQLERIK